MKRSRSLLISGVLALLTIVLVSTWPRPGPGEAAGEGVAAVSAGIAHTCALTSVGGVKCWGDNSYGQLGDGTTTDRTMPVDVVGLGSGMAAIAAGLAHTCALTSGGGVKCWGDNVFGQLGQGSHDLSPHPTPVDVVGLGSGVTAIAAAFDHTCALTSAGGVECWGYNGLGQLGDDQACGSLLCTTPVGVVGLGSGVAGIAAGDSHTCALNSVGGVKCWGYNSYGQLGDGTTTDRTMPVDVVGLGSGMAAIAAGFERTCALTSGGGVKCWGYNFYGQLGEGTTTGPEVCDLGFACSTTPVDVCAEATCTASLSGVAAVSAGDSHTCALTTAGGVECWGYNFYGQLGDGTTTDRTTPVDVVGLGSGMAGIAAGGFHTCALTNGGGVNCWGSNFRGQLGDGTFTHRTTPVDVVGLGSKLTTTPTPTQSDLTTATPQPTRTSTPGPTATPSDTPPAIPTATPTRSPAPTATRTRAPTRTPTPGSSCLIWGDVNRDGRVDAIDATYILQFAAQLLPSLPCQSRADVNGDGQVNAIDATVILQCSAGFYSCATLPL